ncbi:MAG TPA: multicopper oxidase domain-containing protein [Anaerolineaceae bacterium]|nr:multicopper oxidase domain-containing protein [Anaerolineaceae bacterium]
MKLLNLTRLFLVLAVIAGVAFMPGSGSVRTVQADVPVTGIACTTNPSATFTFTSKDGFIQLPDGNTVYMWGYSLGDQNFQHPGPVLCVNQGDTVTIVLHNTLPVDISLTFPGQEGVLANGDLSQPQFGGGGELLSLAQVATAGGGTVTYSFVAGEPGTYYYASGTDPEMQVQMGLFGALIVRPSGQPGWAYNDPTSQFNPDTEFLMLLSEIDPLLHSAVFSQVQAAQPVSYDMTQYRARYWMVNGRSFPDTIAPNGASWLPAQPYSALARIHPYDASTNPLPALERYIGIGPVEYPFHPHGFNGRIIARDGNVLRGPVGNQDQSYEKFSIPVGPGQTFDSIFTWTDVNLYDQTNNPVPVTIPGEQNLTYGQYFSGSPYLGTSEALPPGNTSYVQCGEYYHVAHNHALSTITAWGMTMSGMMTYTRIDPPLPNNCP